MQVSMMRHRLVRKTFEMIEKIAKDEDKQVFQSFLRMICNRWMIITRWEV